MDVDAPSPSISRRHSVPLHRCRFPTWSPSSITSLSLTPTSFDTALLNFGGQSGERGVLAVGRGNGDVDLMVWGGEQGWIAWRTLPSSFPPTPTTSSRKPLPLLSHVLFTHQTTLSPSDMELYSDDLLAARREMKRLKKEGVRLFGVGGRSSELVEWNWGGPGDGVPGKEIGRIKSTLPPLPPIFSLAATANASKLAIGLEDGTIRILNILDDEFELVGKVELGGFGGRVRVTSLIWGLPSSEEVAKAEEEDEDVSMSDASSTIQLPKSFATPPTPVLIAGSSSSSITILRTTTPSAPLSLRPAHRLTLDKVPGEQTVVWSLKLLSANQFASGDSMGNVKFWDLNMGVQKESWKGHRSDVLDLCPGSDGTTLFSTGVDQKTVEYRQVSISSSKSTTTTTSSSSSSRWVQSSGRRLHSHDVRALIVSPPFTPTSIPKSTLVPILTSGGLDFGLITISCSSPEKGLRNPIVGSGSYSTEFENSLHRKAGYVRQREMVFDSTFGGGGSGSGERLLVQRMERGVKVWKLEGPKIMTTTKMTMMMSQKGITSGANAVDSLKRGGNIGWRHKSSYEFPNVGKDIDSDEEDDDKEEEEKKEGKESWKCLLEMELKLQTNLIGIKISPDGKWLVLSDLFETKLFKLSYKNSTLLPRRLKSFSTLLSQSLPSNTLGTGSSTLTFTKDSKRLLLSTCFGSSLVVVDLEEEVKIAVLGGSMTKGVKMTNGNGRAMKGLKVNGLVNGNGNGHAYEESESENEDEDDEAEEEHGDKRSEGTKTTVCCVAVSNDSKWFVTVDLERRVEVYDLESMTHHTTLPTPPLVPVSLTFLPSSTTPTLLLAFPDNSLSLFSLSTLQFLPWSLPLSSPTTNSLMEIREPIIGVTFEPSLVTTTSNAVDKRVHESRRNGTSNPTSPIAIIWGANWVAKIDLDQVELKVESQSAMTKGVMKGTGKKRSRGGEDNARGGGGEGVVFENRVTRRYQPIAYLGFVGAGELCVVERTWFDLAKDLPDAWSRNGEFGT